MTLGLALVWIVAVIVFLAFMVPAWSSLLDVVFGQRRPRVTRWTSIKEVAGLVIGAVLLPLPAAALVAMVLGVAPGDDDSGAANSTRPAVQQVAATVAAPLRAAPDLGRFSDKRGHTALYQKQEISRAAWGDKWPFSTDRAWLVCASEIEAGGGVAVVSGTPWAVTGFAQTMARQWEFRLDIDGVAQRVEPFDADDPRVSRLWREKPKPSGWTDAQWAGMRVSIGPVIDALAAMGC